jgi:hypothetical protein
VKYHLLSAMLVNELKEQDAELRELKARFDVLERRVAQASPPAAVR